MGKSGVVYREVRAIFEGIEGQGLLHLYVLCENTGEIMLGVDGWRHRVFGPDETLLGALKKWGDGELGMPLSWDIGAPK